VADITVSRNVVPHPFFAHTVPGSVDDSEWEPLADHLLAVAKSAERFASEFRASQWGRLAGLWHDLGKYSIRFQDYLRTANGLEAHLEEQPGKVDHSTAGAKHAAHAFNDVTGHWLAFVIAGHHSGLADLGPGSGTLLDRLKKVPEPTDAAPLEITQPGITLTPQDVPLRLQEVPPKSGREFRDAVMGFQAALFTRMVFSCLVDADFLETEAFCNRSQALQRQEFWPTLNDLQAFLRRHLEQKVSTAAASPVNTARQQVLEACRRSASLDPGFFSLTVPTGGGKTLSSLAFALDHAVQKHRSRIIYAIPFTSIIEQTASVFREVFKELGTDVLVEHHSNVDPDDPRRETFRSRLAAENWEVPLVVTTSVQLFESLFANRPARCRKLHNLANSVIILDEAQTLPVQLLQPCLAAMNELVLNYGCTIVLCTATQPAILKRDDFPIGLDPAAVREIIPQPRTLYQSLKRVRVESLGQLTDEQLVERFQGHSSFLAIVNTRKHAAQLFVKLCEQSDHKNSVFHLSTLMCGVHREEVLTAIRQRLKEGLPCQVISTSLIEAGVDVDFPVVYRALSGLDSLAQAAGRCNRDGRLSIGTVFVFEAAEVQPRGLMASMADSARQVLPDHPNDLLSLAAIEQYFQLHYWNQKGEQKWDLAKEGGVMGQFKSLNTLNFKTAASLFQIIEDTGPAVFVPYKDHGTRLLDKFCEQGPSRELLRRLQRYTVTLRQFLFNQLVQAGDVSLVQDAFYVLTNRSSYDGHLGLRTDREGVWDPRDLIP
jgi:CRISPR-associated endonuclease/helicase Cas3